MALRPATRDRAFLLRISPINDTDVVAVLFTEQGGACSVVGRGVRTAGGRRNQRFLEPLHTLHVELVLGSSELGRLRSSEMACARTRMLADLGRLETAGKALRWTRETCPPREPEPSLFLALERLLNSLEATAGEPGRGMGAFADFAVAALNTTGYGLELSVCCQCGRQRPLGRAGVVLAAEGGLVCAVCRGGRMSTTPISGRVLDAAVSASLTSLPDDDAQTLLSAFLPVG